MLNALPPPLLTPRELCTALKLSRREYSRQLHQGLPVAFRSGRIRRFDLSEVLAWNQAQQARAAANREAMVARSRADACRRVDLVTRLTERAKHWPLTRRAR